MFCVSCGHDLKERKAIEASLQSSQPTPQPQPSYSPQPQQPSQPQYIEQQSTGPAVVYGDFLPRFIAWIIDVLIIGVISIIIQFVIGVGSPFVALLIAYVVGFLYFFLLEVGNEGQTIGKLVFGLQAVDESTLQPTTPEKYAINNLLKANFFFLLIDVFIGVITNSGEPGKRYRFMQNASKTVVIKK